MTVVWVFVVTGIMPIVGMLQRRLEKSKGETLSLFVVYSVVSYYFTGLLQFVRRIKLKADLLGVASRKDRTYSALIIDAGVQSTEYGMSLQYDISTEKIRENMREWILYSTFS